MQTRVLRIDPSHPDPAVIAEAVKVLRDGGLVAIPTETVYGLGARALSPAAVARIFEAKGRPPAHPLIVHVGGEASARALASSWSDRASRLARAFWPGPLTLVVPRASHVPSIVTGGADSVAVRAPSHPVARALIESLGEPIAAPSANRYQSLSPTRAEHVVKSLDKRIELVLDGGPCIAGIESTVVDVRGEHARVLRPGALGIAELRAIEPMIEAETSDLAEGALRASPGMDARHYAPRARLVIAPTRAATMELAAHHHGRGERVALITRGPIVGLSLEAHVLPDEPVAFAANLFATLHALDDQGVAVIVVEAVPKNDAWAAVWDRLRRASAIP